ncbi:MAG: hypothetical protein IPM32_18210 [Ignavibacteriae bacterium]|nr:hypothetical protein [Ignavibacteriota bacterium]
MNFKSLNTLKTKSQIGNEILLNIIKNQPLKFGANIEIYLRRFDKLEKPIDDSEINFHNFWSMNSEVNQILNIIQFDGFEKFRKVLRTRSDEVNTRILSAELELCLWEIKNDHPFFNNENEIINNLWTRIGGNLAIIMEYTYYRIAKLKKINFVLDSDQVSFHLTRILDYFKTFELYSEIRLQTQKSEKYTLEMFEKTAEFIREGFSYTKSYEKTLRYFNLQDEKFDSYKKSFHRRYWNNKILGSILNKNSKKQ